jgi:hypothetical protein
VIILPRGHAFELAEGNYDGTHEVIVDGDDEIHVFETRDRDRLQHEPGAPPVTWILPLERVRRALRRRSGSAAASVPAKRDSRRA